MAQRYVKKADSQKMIVIIKKTGCYPMQSSQLVYSAFGRVVELDRLDIAQTGGSRTAQEALKK
jgi:hypothetical protein